MTKLYPYQERAGEALRAGRNVIVQAPTGAGKTLAALYPYFENLERYAEDRYPAQAPLPLTCRYAVPMRVLAAQFEHEYHDWFAKLDRVRATRLQDRYERKLGLKLPAIQTGETPDDPAFESPLTFCTIDQLLASFIGTPYSLSGRQANLNVGAIAGSYLILDEFHLYPLDAGGGARMTALAMLEMLKGFSPFVLMTATFSTRLLEELGKRLGAEVVRATSDDELNSIMNGRSRTIVRSDIEMTAEGILAAHERARARNAGASLVVCDTVARAQEIYVQLREEMKRRELLGRIHLELLHSRFTPEDRRTKSEDLERLLGKGNWQGGRFIGHETIHETIIVGTQVVEVGLNISAGVLHTELAPANSIIQRAGRCARFDQQYGEVIVYPIPPRANGNVSYRPYDERLCNATWNYLGEQLAASGNRMLPFGFNEEQQLIDAVHTHEDERMLEHFAEREGQIARVVMETLASHEYARVSELIRSVTSVSVVIHNDPEHVITTKPFTWESFQLHPGTLKGAWEQLQERSNGSWAMKQLQPLGDLPGQAEEDNDRETHYTWVPLTQRDQIDKAMRLALPPTLATYDRELGFRLLLEDEQERQGDELWMSKLVERKRKKSTFDLGKQGSYVEHITGLVRAYEWSVRRELAWVGMRLEQALGLAPESLDEAIRLAIACHDIGKLSREWQRWAHEWQALLVSTFGQQYVIAPGREVLAKTDRLSNWSMEKELQQVLKIPRPPHACAGVIAAHQFIGQQTLTRAPAAKEGALALTRAALSAIARHHAPTATTYDAVSWDQSGACDVLAQAFTACRISGDLDELDLSPRPAGEVRREMLVTPSNDTRIGLLTTWLGFVLVRALRLCDQRAERDW